MKSKRSISSVSSVIASVGLAVFLSACAGLYDGQVSDAPSVPNLDDPSQRSAALLRYCEKLRTSGDLELAAGICNRAHELNPTDPEPLLQLAGVMQSLGMRDSAAEAYRAVILIDPRRVDALYGLGKIHIDARRYDLARLQLEEASLVADDDPRIHNALGVIMDQRGEHAAAQDHYRQGLSRTPESVSLRNNLGLSLVLDGNQEAGLALLREVAAEPTAGPAVGRNLAMAHQMAALPAPDSLGAPMARAPMADVEIAEMPAQSAGMTEMALSAGASAPTTSDRMVPRAEMVASDPLPVARTREDAVAAMPADPVPAEFVPAKIATAEVVPAQIATAEVVPAQIATAEVVPAEIATAETVHPQIMTDREIATPVAPTARAVASHGPATRPVRLLDGPVSASVWRTSAVPTANPHQDEQLEMAAESAPAVRGVHPPAMLDRAAVEPSDDFPRDTRTATPGAPNADAPYPIRRDAIMKTARTALPNSGPGPHDGGQDYTRTTQPEPEPSDLPIETAGTPEADEWIHSVQLSSLPSEEGARQSWREIRETAADVLTGIDAVILRADLGAGMGVVYRVRTDAMEYRQAADLCERLKTKGLDCFSVKASRQSTIEATVERICASGTATEDCAAPMSAPMPAPLRNTGLPSPHRNAV